MANNYITLTDENFQSEVIESDLPVLVDFWAAWCGPCRALTPVIEQLADEYQGRAKIAKLNVDENPAAASSYKVRSIPTLLVFRNGEVVDSIVGLAPKQTLEAKLSPHLKAA